MLENLKKANCLPLLIGSLPVKDHYEALQIMLKYSNQIPLWVQLPFYKQEQMIFQFTSGLPGLELKNNFEFFINTQDLNFDKKIIEFYEEYIKTQDNQDYLNNINSRFALNKEIAKGFFVLLDYLKNYKLEISQNKYSQDNIKALKGQITGPLTFGIGIKDETGKSIFYNEQLRDILTKLLAFKAKWQARKLSQFFGVKKPVIIFIDEPGIVGLVSSEYISISKQDVQACLQEIIAAIHEEKGFAGIHVCANGDWSAVLTLPIDIVSFDAYCFFDKFILYKDYIKSFLQAGKTLAWGIVPTLRAEDIEKETLESLFQNFENKANELSRVLQISLKCILEQSFITPSCGTGSLKLDHALKVLKLTQELSQKIVSKYF